VTVEVVGGRGPSSAWLGAQSARRRKSGHFGRDDTFRFGGFLRQESRKRQTQDGGVKPPLQVKFGVEGVGKIRGLADKPSLSGCWPS